MSSVGFKYCERQFFRIGRELQDTLLFQCDLGVGNALLFWPFVLALHCSDLEPFHLPSTREQWPQGVVLPCSLDLIFTLSRLCGVACRGSPFVSMGLILIIRVNFFADIVVIKKQSVETINAYSVIGAVCIVGAFIVIQSDQRDKDNDQRAQRAK